MEPNDSTGIRWDKVEALLKLPSLSTESMNDLTEDERVVLLFLRRTGILLSGEDAEREFPLEEGRKMMREHMAAGGTRRAAPVFGLRRMLFAAAVMLPVVLAGIFWWKTQHKPVKDSRMEAAPPVAIADLPPTQGVQLILAGGRRVALDTMKVLTEKDGATIHASKGTVTYQPATASASVFYNTLEVPRGNQTKLILPDGTKVWINAASRLTYPTVFAGDTRDITMEGQAFFEVSQDPAHPFIVHTRGMAVKVLGTSFDINTYDPEVLTTLTEGKVSVSEGDGGAAVVLGPGDQALYETDKKDLHKKSNVDTYPYTCWKDGFIYLKDASFQRIAEQLGRKYDYTLVFDDPALANLHFRLSMKAPDKLQDVLSYLTRTIEGVGFETAGREVRFFKKGG